MEAAGSAPQHEAVKQKLKGVITPVTTPFDNSGRVHLQELRNNIAILIESGVQGILVAGSTGEAPLLSTREFAEVTAAAREAIPGEKVMLVGAGMESTQGTVAACRIAGELEPDAVLVRPPSYYAPLLDDTALRNHFERVADSSPVPVLIYNMPKYTGIHMSPELIRSIGSHPDVVGVKDSSGNMESLDRYLDAAPELAVLAGSASVLLPALRRGAVGGIIAASCFAPRLAVSICQGFSTDSRAADTDARQDRLSRLNQEIVGRLGIAGIKAAMDQVGSFGGSVRPPLRDLDPPLREQVRELIQAHLN